MHEVRVARDTTVAAPTFAFSRAASSTSRLYCSTRVSLRHATLVDDDERRRLRSREPCSRERRDPKRSDGGRRD